MTRIIKADATHLAPPAKTLNLADLAAEARAIILDARKQAAQILGDARQQADEERMAAARKAHAEGFARGQAEGYAAGKQQAVREMRETAAAGSSEMAALLKTAADELSAGRMEVLRQARSGMLDFALALAQKVVGKVAAADIAAAQHNLARALEMVQADGKVTVQVNPSQLERLKEYCPLVAGPLGLAGEIAFVADGAVAPGGVKVTAGQCRIDATICEQFDNIARELCGR